MDVVLIGMMLLVGGDVLCATSTIRCVASDAVDVDVGMRVLLNACDDVDVVIARVVASTCCDVDVVMGRVAANVDVSIHSDSDVARR